MVSVIDLWERSILVSHSVLSRWAKEILLFWSLGVLVETVDVKFLLRVQKCGISSLSLPLGKLACHM
jgi:hypothetical protein